LFFLPFLCTSTFARQIILDEEFNDWEDVESQFSDPEGDSDNIDLFTLKISNDDRFIYFLLEVSEEIDLQENNDLVLYIDTDNNIETGIESNGIGYEFEFSFGQRTGIFHSDQNINLSPYDVGLIASPTVTSTTIEFKLNLDAEVNGIKIFGSDELSLFIYSVSGNEFLPNEGEAALYQLDIQSTFEPQPFQIAKNSGYDFRVLSYNVRRDALFNAGLKNEYQRIISAVQPDIIGFQEVYQNSGAQAAELVEEFIPSQDGEMWYSGDTGTDNLIVSRYPVIKSKTVNGNSVYLLDAVDFFIFVIVAHPPCCANNEGRQLEIDAFMAFLRDSKNGEEFNIPENTPIIIMGDMNLVGLSQQQTTLITGDIINEDAYGSDFNPDWDGSALEDAKPNNPGFPTSFTWFSQNSSFGAGRLDYMVYSGSVLEMLNTFSLHTPTLDSDTLSVYNLEVLDTILASDHTPVVADFKFKTQTSTDRLESDGPENFTLFQNYPNPFNPSTTIPFEISKPAKVSLTVHTINGVKVASIIENKYLNSGEYSFVYKAEELASGIYFYRLNVDGAIQNNMMVLIK